METKMNLNEWIAAGKPLNSYINCDNMELMKLIPDNYIDISIVDPPYGIERFKKGSLRFDKSEKAKNGLKWDEKPDEEYFLELFRISKYCIIWGANNFILPTTEYFLIWNKKQTVDNFASAEYAWTNCHIPAKVFDYSIHKCMSDRKSDGGKIHPTQKPIALYRWILQNYAKPNDIIFDSHVGSASSLIACHEEGFKYIACELDEDYYRDSCKRLETHLSQLKLF